MHCGRLKLKSLGARASGKLIWSAASYHRGTLVRVNEVSLQHNAIIVDFVEATSYSLKSLKMGSEVDCSGVSRAVWLVKVTKLMIPKKLFTFGV